MPTYKTFRCPRCNIVAPRPPVAGTCADCADWYEVVENRRQSRYAALRNLELMAQRSETTRHRELLASAYNLTINGLQLEGD